MTFAAPRRAAVSRPIVPAINVVAVIWPVLSVAMLLYVVVGFAQLHRLRRHWRAANIGATCVMVSDDTGPAVVGMLRPTIVIPEWVLRFDPQHLSLVLRHEREHQRSGDASVLALAQLALVATPWNPVAWWQVRRLRLAIELDCDARVLRAEPDVRSYGNLLLEVGRPRGGFALVGASLSGRAGELEQRIRMMTRRGRGVSKSGAVLSVGAGLLAIGVGCGLPAPQRPAPVAAPPSVATETPKGAVDTSTARASKAPLSGARNSTAVKPANAKEGTNSGADSVTDPMQSLIQKLRAADDSARRETGQLPDTATERHLEALVGKLRAATGASTAPCDASPTLHPARDPSRIQNPVSIQARTPPTMDSCTYEALFRSAVSDSAAAEAPVPACTAGAGPADTVVIKLIVSNSMTRSDGRIELDGGSATDDGTSVQLRDPQTGERTMSCTLGRTGTLRVFGVGAFNGNPIVVRVSRPTSLTVVSGSGRVLVAPTAIPQESRRLLLEWKAAQE
jgi:hypothetical protein